MVQSLDWVYDHLVCEFGHWDICLSGLVEFEGDKYFCKVVNPDAKYEDDDTKVLYAISPIVWNNECTEYLEDYRKAYLHWFHKDGKRCSYDGRPLDWFSEKWKHRNPIAEQAVKQS